MKKKNDKIRLVLLSILVYLVFSWIIEGGMYGAAGTFTNVGIIRMGIFDIISVIYSAFYYRVGDLAFLFTIGGCYEVLSHTLMYRKLVDKVSSFIKGKEEIAMVVITTLMALYASISSNILVLFAVAPFIVTLFLRNNYNRLTAFSAGFGGMFLGYIGLTYGTYNMSYLNDALVMEPTDWIFQKWLILILGIVVFNVFNILYMNKYKNGGDQTKHDMFATEPIAKEEELVGKKKKPVKVWPIVLILSISLLTLLLGFINWSTSFNVNVFNKIYTSMFENFSIADVPILSALFGTRLTAFGTWGDLLYALFVFVFAVIVIALISKVKLNEFIDYFANGMKKIAKVVFIYGFANVVLFLFTSYPWPGTIINALFGSGAFNIIVLLIIAIVATIFTGDAYYSSYMFGPALAVLFGSNLIESGIIWRVGSAIATMVGPTSYILLAALTYLNIPYKAWLKYIWKFLAVFSLVLMIMFAVIVYV